MEENPITISKKWMSPNGGAERGLPSGISIKRASVTEYAREVVGHLKHGCGRAD